MSSIKRKVPVMDFPVRVETDENPGWKWDTLTYDQIFAGKKVIVFGLPGAYTPTCTTNQLPGYEAFYEQFRAEGIDEIFCCSVNDTFVMNSWFREVNVEKVKPMPDGTGKFTRQMGFLVDKSVIGFGLRSWRYAMIVNDGNIEAIFEEPGYSDECPDDPYQVSDPNTVLQFIKSGTLPSIDDQNEE